MSKRNRQRKEAQRKNVAEHRGYDFRNQPKARMDGESVPADIGWRKPAPETFLGVELPRPPEKVVKGEVVSVKRNR